MKLTPLLTAAAITLALPTEACKRPIAPQANDAGIASVSRDTHSSAHGVLHTEKASSPSGNTDSGVIIQGTLDKNGKLRGLGEIIYPGGAKEIGRFRHGKLHGKGKIILPSGTFIEGQFANGKFIESDREDLDCSNEEVTCKTGNLEGVALRSLFTQYTGIEEEAPEKVNINFYGRLELMWEKKKEISPDNPVVQEIASTILDEYKKKPHDTVSMKDYETIIADVLDETNSEISWDKIAELKNMNRGERKLAEKVVKLITAKDVVAYSLTELMPSANGELNKNMLEFLLKNAGTRFLYSIPALGDRWTSFGPYQFTSFALHDIPEDRRGASVINQALPKDIRIPGSMIKLRGEDHHRAAFLFMIDNICDLIKRSNDASGWKKLETNKEAMRKQIIIFCAVAHHLPSRAKTQAAEWLENGADDQLIDHLTDLTEYARKTTANVEGLSEE